MIASSSHFMNGQAKLSLKMLKLFPYRTSTYSQGGAKILTRMESAIFQEVQQRQHAGLALTMRPE
ncbi:hypothetical protein EMIT0P265_100328 [Pseudomonas zeae]